MPWPQAPQQRRVSFWPTRNWSAQLMELQRPVNRVVVTMQSNHIASLSVLLFRFPSCFFPLPHRHQQEEIEEQVFDIGLTIQMQRIAWAGVDG